MKSTKKPDKWKKHSVSIIVLATLFGRNLSSSDFSSSLSYLSRKKGTSETFLSLGLFISRPRPAASASKIRPRLRKTFPQFPFFYFGNLEKLKSDEDKFFLRVASTIIETKYYCWIWFCHISYNSYCVIFRKSGTPPLRTLDIHFNYPCYPQERPSSHK